MQTLVIASNNAGKVAELTDSLDGLPWQVRPQSEWHITDAEEVFGTFVENALAKVRHAAQHTGYPALADDSGLCVTALGGAPGVLSRRFSSSGLDLDNNIKLLAALQNESNRHAYFVCVLVMVRSVSDPFPIIASGTWHGEISHAAQGTSGFGYDPIFYLPQLGKTAAQLSRHEKMQLSHRAQAISALRQQLMVLSKL